MQPFVTRFAPSPTGYLHIGHAYSAMLAAQSAKQAAGKFVLRIEDTDQTRCRPHFEEATYVDLQWLGLQWDGPVRRQSDHLIEYQNLLAELDAKGLLYRCFKTRKEVLAAIASAPHDQEPGIMHGEVPYFGEPLPEAEERDRLSFGANFAWRLSMQSAKKYLGTRWDQLSFLEEGEGPAGESGKIPVKPDLFGDVILARKDTGTSYHLACTHDDALQGITHIIRGTDLFYVTHLHVLLQALCDWPTPVYRHHALLTDETGKKFSKRDQGKTLQAMRQSGMTPGEVRAQFPA